MLTLTELKKINKDSMPQIKIYTFIYSSVFSGNGPVAFIKNHSNTKITSFQNEKSL